MEEIVEKLRPVVVDILEGFGLELFDMSFTKQRGKWTLKIVIDDPNGYVSIRQCEQVSNEVGKYLDLHEDLIPTSYILEVSSPGLDRPLRGPKDYKRFAGRLAKFWLSEGKVVTGHIGELSEDELKVNTDQGEVVLKLSQIKKARLEVEF
ncbi:ribosome maturation factor [Pseudothermotoga thermarum]|uniref:ribosome maturation factor n=1 Tax=Pseudothermotoga thermarum TaxID=119394 RepID=UPI0002E60F46|nr:ribosome maturation factor [Pseudothermotoga thermarum]